ncbi:Hypothetical predicted protein [Olea europaea subsp. europaea]|nr:Hypothetical predicted protein [Olea europaea subsp. europaea]
MLGRENLPPPGLLSLTMVDKATLVFKVLFIKKLVDLVADWVNINLGSSGLTSSQGGMRVYICDHDTSPPD